MKKLFIENEIEYTGVQLSPHWIYKNYKIQGDAIVSFIGPVCVNLSEMVDIEDVINNEPIKSDKMVNFIIEVFDTNLREAIYRQRLFISIIKEVFETRGINLKRFGDDLYYDNRKLSVSIATKSTVSTLIHTALNIVSKGAPIPVSSFEDMGISDTTCIINEIMKKFCMEVSDIELARVKVRGV